MGEGINMQKIKVITLFSGIGSQEMALRNLGLDYEVVGISEIDKFAIKSYEAIHGEVHNFGDISKIEELPYCDLLTYSFPCQDLSVAGKQKGIGKDTRSGLLLEVERLLLKAKQNGTLPKFLLLENVKNLVGKKFIKDFERWLSFLNSLGYYSNWEVLNAKDYGIPQNRERVFVVSSLKNIHYVFPKKQELKIKMKDLLEEHVPEKYYLTEKTLKGFLDESNRNGFIRSDKFKPHSENSKIAFTVKTKEGSRCTDNFVIQLGNLKNTESFGGNPHTGRVYSPDGISPCLNTMQGGGLEPKILQKAHGFNKGGVKENIVPAMTSSSWQENNILVENVEISKKRKDIKEYNKKCKYCGKKLERKRFNGRLEDFTVFKKRNYCERECMRKDYLKVGKNNQSFSNSHTTARNINKLILKKDCCEKCGSTKNLDIHHVDGDWQNNNLNNLMCLCRSCHIKEHRSKNNIRIRKLTPLEVWRLMGFSDTDFYAAKSAGISDAQLYKQAGNSIVVTVLEAIFRQLFLKKHNKKQGIIAEQMHLFQGVG